jgi:NAD(P)-dependent dehydrogenase (short-subunit alcohol dehydrogenase family)
MNDLSGKVCVITGSTSGMGKAAAILFSKEGAKVVITGRHEDEGLNVVKECPNSIFIKLDVSVEDSVKAMIAEVIKKYGRLDVLYNNAGVEEMIPITKVTNEFVDKILGINLKGILLCCAHAIPYMKKGSSIINTASIGGLIGYSNLSVYCASKGGVIALTRSLALELASKGIRVNCICPGPIFTPMVSNQLKILPAKWIADNEVKKQVPMGRFGTAEEVANLALFLASNKSSFMTGSIIPIDGGATSK